MKTKLLLMFLAAAALSAAAGAAEVTILNAGFEDPVLADGTFEYYATGWTEGWYDLNAPDPTQWGGFPWGAGAQNPDIAYGYEGIAPEGENIAFTTADPGYDGGLSQSLPEILQSGWTYELSALVGNPYPYNGGATCDYRIELVAGGVVVASTNDNGLGQGDPSPVNDESWTTASLTFTPDPDNPQIGKALEIRLIAVDFDYSYYEVNFDDIKLNAYADPMNPSPYDGESVYADDVDLSWTNMDPNEGVTDVYVDVWFGTDPNRPNKPGCWDHILDATTDQGKNATTVTVPAFIIEPEPTTYFWKVNSYIYGADNINEPNMIEGRIYRFYATTDLPIESVDVGPDIVTWSGEVVQLDGAVVDDGVSGLTYAWSAAPADGVSFSATDIEDPDVTISKSAGVGPIPIVNAGFEDPVLADGNRTLYTTGWTEGWYDLAVDPDAWGGFPWAAGAVNPDDKYGYIGIAPEGENVAFVTPDAGYDQGLSQILSYTLQSGWTYELSALVGNPYNYNDGATADYRIELVAGNVVVASDTGPSPADDTYWTTGSLTFTPDLNHPQLGELLEIRLIAVDFSRNYELNFDDVKLVASGEGAPPLSVILTLAVNDELNTMPVEDTMTIEVYDDACKAAIGAGKNADNPGDINANCITGLEDLSEMVSTWLNDTGLTGAASLTGTSANFELIDGLVEYWVLDGDYSAGVTSSHVGTLQTIGTGSGTFVSGKFGQGIDLENSSGNQAYIVIGGDENDFDFAEGNMSISLWYTTESLYTNWQCLAAKGENENWRLHRLENSNTEIDFYAGGISVTGDGELDQQDGSWHHVVVTTDAVNGGNLYIDGILVDSVSGSVANAGNNAAMQIGGNPNAVDRGWDGILDDVAFWNRALTADEVSLIWNGGAGISIGNIAGISPYDGETVWAGYVDLSWTNPGSNDPSDPNGPVWVDVWFGTDPISDYTKVVEAGENKTTVQVYAPDIGETYYWQVDSYLNGSPTGDPNEGPLRTFYTADLPPDVHVGDDIITWSGEAVTMDAIVEDGGLSELSYSWSADPDDGVEFSNPAALAPTVTITKPTGDAVTVTMTLSVDDGFNPPVEDAMTIGVYDNNCLAAKAADLAEIDAGDFDVDCDTDIEDFAAMAETWLVDYTLTEPIEKP